MWIQTRALLVFAALTTLVAWLGSVMTMQSVNTDWFASLEKPGFYPPDAAFGIVWTVLYAFIALAGWLAWRNGGGVRGLVPWTIQLLLNLGWTVVFFGAQEPVWGLVVIVALFAAAIWAAASVHRFSQMATYLFVPYILWIGFAGILNGAIVALN